MDSILIQGERRLDGVVRISGAVETETLRTMRPVAPFLPSTAIQYGPEPSTTKLALLVPPPPESSSAASCFRLESPEPV